MWDKCKVKLLPSDKESGLILSDGVLFSVDHPYVKGRTRLVPGRESYQRICVTSDEEIRDGDLYYCSFTRKVLPTRGYDIKDLNKGRYTKKVVAMGEDAVKFLGKSTHGTSTSDVYSKFPKIPSQFIERYIREYNKGNVITDVLVEYAEVSRDTSEIIGMDGIPNGLPFYECNLKVAHDNTINIRLPKVIWRREEVVELLIKTITACNATDGELLDKEPHEAAKWIEENL